MCIETLVNICVNTYLLLYICLFKKKRQSVVALFHHLSILFRLISYHNRKFVLLLHYFYFGFLYSSLSHSRQHLTRSAHLAFPPTISLHHMTPFSFNISVTLLSSPFTNCGFAVQASTSKKF